MELNGSLKTPKGSHKLRGVDDKQRAARAVEARLGALGMTQAQLAATAKVDAKTLGDLIRGRRWPIAKSRARIEEALGWPPGEIARIASAPPEEGSPPRATPEGLLQAIYDELPPERAERVAAVVEAELSGRAVPTGRR
jgi:transcriptional regulator with XRE-family HTH domain